MKKPPRQLRKDGWRGSPPRAAFPRGRSRDKGVDEAQKPVAVARCGDTRQCPMSKVYWFAGTLGVEALVGGGAHRTPGRVQARSRGTVDCDFISSHPALMKCVRTVFAPRPLRFRAFVRPDPRVCDEHLLETTFQRATPPRFAVRTCHSGGWRRVWLSL